jgi:N4-gp56 family major capsid protein
VTTLYGDISPRTAAYAAARLLDRALPQMSMGRFGQQQPIPKNRTNTVKFRRYNGFPPQLTPLAEGITPAPDQITHTDVEATLRQYGRRVQISDVVMDTHEDPVLMEQTEILGEVAAQTQELVIFNAIRAGTNVLFSGSSNSLRTGINSAVTAAVLNRLIRQLKRQNTKPITRMLAASDKVSTAGIRPAFVVFCHPDLQTDLEAITGFKPPVEYGTYLPIGENEIGAYKELRFLTSTLYAPLLAAGTANAGQTTFLTNGGSSASAAGACDVYQLIAVGRDAYATISLAGANAVVPMVVNPKPSDSDPMGQRGHVAFKMYSTACILNDAWMCRVECAVNN